jgi:hypothetical protein
LVLGSFGKSIYGEGEFVNGYLKCNDGEFWLGDFLLLVFCSL